MNLLILVEWDEGIDIPASLIWVDLKSHHLSEDSSVCEADMAAITYIMSGSSVVDSGYIHTRRSTTEWFTCIVDGSSSISYKKEQ